MTREQAEAAGWDFSFRPLGSEFCDCRSINPTIHLGNPGSVAADELQGRLNAAAGPRPWRGSPFLDQPQPPQGWGVVPGGGSPGHWPRGQASAGIAALNVRTQPQAWHWSNRRRRVRRSLQPLQTARRAAFASGSSSRPPSAT